MTAFSRRTFLAGVVALFIPARLRAAAPPTRLRLEKTHYTLEADRWYRIEVYNRHPIKAAQLTLGTDGAVRMNHTVPPGAYSRHNVCSRDPLILRDDNGYVTIRVIPAELV